MTKLFITDSADFDENNSEEMEWVPANAALHLEVLPESEYDDEEILDMVEAAANELDRAVANAERRGLIVPFRVIR